MQYIDIHIIITPVKKSLDNQFAIYRLLVNKMERENTIQHSTSNNKVK